VSPGVGDSTIIAITVGLLGLLALFVYEAPAPTPVKACSVPEEIILVCEETYSGARKVLRCTDRDGDEFLMFNPETL